MPIVVQAQGYSYTAIKVLD